MLEAVTSPFVMSAIATNTAGERGKDFPRAQRLTRAWLDAPMRSATSVYVTPSRLHHASKSIAIPNTLFEKRTQRKSARETLCCETATDHE